MTNQRWSRRMALRGIAGSGLVFLAGAVLSACGGTASVTAPTTAAGTSTATVAATTPAGSTATASTTAVATTASTAAITSAVSSGAATVSAVSSTPSTVPAATGSKAAANGVEYWHVFGGTDTATMDHMVEAFQTAHPDIPVQSTNVGFGKMKQKLTTAIAGGAPPNVFMNGDAPVASAYGVLGVAKAVDSFAKQDGITADLFLPALQPTFV